MKFAGYFGPLFLAMVGAASGEPAAGAERGVAVDFADETPGAEPNALLSVVGTWRIESHAGKKVLAVDGRQWREGQPSPAAAENARALFAERSEAFLDRVQARASYPYAVLRSLADFRAGDIAVRFACQSGQVDQGAGILFNLQPNGDYLTVRANCLENNLVLWKFADGRRSQLKWINDTPTAAHQWHDMTIRIDGAKVEAYLDGKLHLDHTLAEPVTGRIGLWSKADSYTHFSDFVATPSH